MKLPATACLALLLLFGVVGQALAEGRWRDLPPEERRQMRQQMREHWEQEREIRQERGGPLRWRELPEEDRRRLRDEMRERHGWPDRPDGPHGSGRGWRRD